MNKRIFKSNRRGAAIVETAVVAPLLILSMFGMIEVGYAFMIKQTVTLASREGARSGALPGATEADVTAAVDAAMTAAHLTGYTTTSNIGTLSASDLEIWVQVSLPLNRASFTGNMLGGGSFDIVGRTTMRREGLDSSGGDESP